MRHTVTLCPKTTVSDTLFILLYRNRKKHQIQTIQFFHGCYTVQSCNLHISLYFSTLMGTVCTLSLRLQLLIGSQEIIVLLHNRRTSHSEQPSTFFLHLINIRHRPPRENCIALLHLSQPILIDNLRTLKSLQYSI